MDITRHSEAASMYGYSLSRRQFLKATGLAAVAVAAAACGGSSDPASRFAGMPVADEPNGQLAKVVWPDFVTSAPPEVRQLYEFQIQNGDLMRYMPCYCGCGSEAGHMNNRDCYVRSVSADGTVTLDSMAPT